MLIRVNDWLKTSGNRQKVEIKELVKESSLIIVPTTTAGHHFCLNLYYDFIEKNHWNSVIHYYGLQHVEQTTRWSVRNGEPGRVSGSDFDIYLYDLIGRPSSDYLLTSY